MGVARHLLWTRRDRPGLEHLRFRSNRDRGGGVRAQGTAVGLVAGAPVAVQYEFRCDREWRTRAVDVTVRGPVSGRASLSADDPGAWTDTRDEPRVELDGCLDGAVATTAFSHTLPIARLDLDVGETGEVRVARLRVPDAGVEPVRRRYVRTGTDAYRVETPPGGDATEFRTDAEGFVAESPAVALTTTATDE